MPVPNVLLKRGGSQRRGGTVWLTSGGRTGRRRSGYQPDMSAPPEERLAALRAYESENGSPRAEIGPKEQTVQGIARILGSPVEEVQAEGLKKLRENADDISPQLAKKYGLEEALRIATTENSKDVPLWKKALSPGMKVLEVLGRPQQATAEAIQVGTQALGIDEKMREFEAGGGEYVPTRLAAREGAEGGAKDILLALQGKPRFDETTGEMTNNLGFASALGVDRRGYEGAASKVLTGAEFLGGAATDPLVFAGGGSKAAAQSVSAVAAKELAQEGGEGLTKALTKQLAKQGSKEITEETLQAAIRKIGLRKATTAEQREIVRQALIDSTGTSRTTKRLFSEATREVPIRGDRAFGAGFRRLTGRGSREGAERVADNLLSGALRYDRGGLRVAGRTVTPSRGRATQVLGTERAAQEVLDDASRLANRQTKIEELYTRRAEDTADRLTALKARDDGNPAIAEMIAKEQDKYDRLVEVATQSARTRAGLDEAVLAGDAEAALAVNEGLGNALTPLVERGPGLLNKIADTSPAKSIRSSFKPRAQIADSLSLPAGTDEAVYQLTSEGRSVAQHEGRRVLARLEQAAKGAGDVTDDEFKQMLAALDQGGSVDDLAASLPTERAALLREIDTIRKETYDRIRERDLMPLGNMRAQQDYMPRYYTKEGKKAIEAALDRGMKTFSPFSRSSSAKQAGNQAGHSLARTFDRDLSILDMNAKYEPILRDAGLLPEGASLLETNPVQLTARRAMDAIRADEAIRTIDNMADNLKGPLGTKLVQRVKPSMSGEEAAKIQANATSRGLVAVDLGEAGTAYTHPDLVPEITEFNQVIGNADEVAKFGKFMDDWNRMWKSYATVPLLGTSFHTKNSIGNMFNNTLRGVRFSAYPEALSLQRQVSKAKKAFPDLPVPEAMIRNGASEADAARIEMALEQGVIDEGFFRTDLGVDELNKLAGKKLTSKERLTAKVDPRNPQDMLGVPSGRKVGELIEDNARLAHFLSKVDEFGDPAMAGRSVKEALFDYGDLTPFERKVMKRVNAFYTFTRKNTPFQFAELARNPAAVNRMANAETALFGQDEPYTGEGVPRWMADMGRPTGRGTAALLTGDRNPLVANMETPFEATTEAIDPLLQLAGMTPGLKEIAPVEDPSIQKASLGALRNFSGGPAELVKLAAEEATGRSLFTGSSLVDPEGNRKANPLVRLGNAFVPAVGKTERIANLSGASSDELRLRLVKLMTGLSAREAAPDEANSSQAYEIRELIDELTQRGEDVPTLAELRRIGVVPEREQD